MSEMFSEFEMGDYTEETPSSESTEQNLDTTSIEADVNVADTQIDNQGNISDAIQGEKTVSFSAFEAVKNGWEKDKDRIDQLLKLVVEGNKQTQSKQAEQEPIKDEFADLDPEGFIQNRDMLKIVDYKVNQVVNKLKSEINESNQNAYRNKVDAYEVEYEKEHPDYRETITVLTPDLVATLSKSISDPAELVQKAYLIASALKGSIANPSAQPATTAKQAVDVAAKLEQNQNKAKTISGVKGSSSIISDAEKVADALLAEL